MEVSTGGTGVLKVKGTGILGVEIGDKMIAQVYNYLMFD